jgi:glucose-1-phosphate cytidylyltransferase
MIQDRDIQPSWGGTTMKVVVLAGGYGTRLSEETSVRPKPMVEVGGMPIIWHIMKIYAHYGLTDFVVCCGYKAEYIKDYFVRFFQNTSDFQVDLSNGDIRMLNRRAEPWKVTLLDTGLRTMTGGRIRRARDAIGDDSFCLTYGDGVSDVNIADLIEFHRSSQAWATLTAVTQPGRYGAISLSPDGDRVQAFREKAARDGAVINGGFFVCEPKVFDLIDGDETVWEESPLMRLVEMGKLAAYRHEGFWQSMDTLRDKTVLEEAWASGNAPWRVWPEQPMLRLIEGVGWQPAAIQPERGAA